MLPFENMPIIVRERERVTNGFELRKFGGMPYLSLKGGASGSYNFNKRKYD
jgi:hypothetical protein